MVLTYVVVILVGLVIRASFIVWSCDHVCGCCGGCLVSCNRDDNRVLMCSVVVVCLVVILVICARDMSVQRICMPVDRASGHTRILLILVSCVTRVCGIVCMYVRI